MMKMDHIVSTLNSRLRDEGIYRSTASNALVRVLARYREAAAKEQEKLQKTDTLRDRDRRKK